MQQLVDQGVTILDAFTIVSETYPVTHGDTFYRLDGGHPDNDDAVGVYALWNRLRGNQSPMGGVKVSDDARTIAQFLRLNGSKIADVVAITDRRDEAITEVARQAAMMMRRGDYFEPVAIEEENLMPDRLNELRRSIAKMDGAADYLSSIPQPHFGS